MELRRFITKEIRRCLSENLNKQKSKNSNLSDELWNLVNSKYFMNWSKNWSEVLMDENNEPAIFYRGVSLYNDEDVIWNFSKSFFTKDKSYAQKYAINHDTGDFNKDLVFSFFLKSKFTIHIDDYSYGGEGIDSYRIKNKYADWKNEFKDYEKFILDFKKADIIVGDEDGSKNYSYYVKDDKNILPVKKLIEFVKKETENK